MILYLHGFRSSPSSFKAQLIADFLQRTGRGTEYICPQLPTSPKLAIKNLTTLCSTINSAELTLVGSSLGGYYATYLAEHFSCRAVLLNPAVKPSRDLASYVGVTTQYHTDEVIEFKQKYVHELALYEIEKITKPERYFLIAATGDEVLNWEEMVTHYPGAQQHVIQGSNHGISEFEQYIAQVVAFCDDV
ncbi:MAG: hypothetical protein K0R08_2201 [Solimicrobium sp.]|jgi:predicted esterase YcpF (UPF0227 family)|nr:hypothetical protein [Solimicrobium sp.]